MLPDDADIEAKMVFVREYRQALDRSGTKIGFCVLFGAFFQTLYEFVIGLEDTMKLVYEDREFVDHLLDISAAWCAKFCAAAVKNGVDFVWTADDVAFKTGLFLPPALMREMWLPKLKRIHEPALAAGKPDHVPLRRQRRRAGAHAPRGGRGLPATRWTPTAWTTARSRRSSATGSASRATSTSSSPWRTARPQDVEKDVKAHMEALKPGRRLRLRLQPQHRELRARTRTSSRCSTRSTATACTTRRAGRALP